MVRCVVEQYYQLEVKYLNKSDQKLICFTPQIQHIDAAQRLSRFTETEKKCGTQSVEACVY